MRLEGQIPTTETEILSIRAGEDENGLGVGLITVRTNRSRGNLKPMTFQISRASLERLVDDATFLLDYSEILNNKETIDSVERVDISSLPERDDPVFEG